MKSARREEDAIGDLCEGLQEWVFEKANYWSDQIEYLEFTDEQEMESWNEMQDKFEAEQKYGKSISASWLRLALIVKRIAATLAAFQGTAGAIPENCWKPQY